MVKRRCAWVLLAVMIPVISVSTAFGETDFAYWNEESIEGKITERLSAGISMKYRFNDDAKQHYYTSTELELNYELLSRLEAGAGYKEVFKLKDGFWEQENRPYIQTVIKWTSGGWKFKNRLRAELREKQDASPYYRFRDKLTAKSPWKWTALEINPYFAEEVFIDEEKGEGFNESRTYAGVEMKLAERLGLSVYYMYNIERSDREWNDRVNVVGTELKLSF